MQSQMCEVCGKIISKYKCPKCVTRYCSVDCYKSHQDSDCKQKQETIKQDVNKGDQSTKVPVVPDVRSILGDENSEDRVSTERLQMLEESEDLRNMLQNPHLRDMMRGLTTAADPTVAMEKCMQEPIFVEFADQCLSIVEKQENVSCLVED